jgi:hypothetical protein
VAAAGAPPRGSPGGGVLAAARRGASGALGSSMTCASIALRSRARRCFRMAVKPGAEGDTNSVMPQSASFTILGG